MSLSFGFLMDATVNPETVESLLIGHCGLFRHDKWTLFNEGCDLSQIESSPRSQELHRRWFGFAAGIRWVCNLRTDEGKYELGVRTVICATQTLLNYVEGDAVLLWNTAIIYLQRKGGIVTIAPGVWSAERLALFHIPYRLEPIPNTLD